ncbi:hypothetical protein D1872_304680 [compost metagenome]
MKEAIEMGMKSSIAKGLNSTSPASPMTALVLSDSSAAAIVAIPWSQLKASFTGTHVSESLPPKSIACTGTPAGSSTCSSTMGRL